MKNPFIVSFWIAAMALVSCSTPTGEEPALNNPPSEVSYHNSFRNPIIPGFAPDPSICRAPREGEPGVYDYYLVNSTFEYWPGVPVYHATDLVNWELIGYAFDNYGEVEMDTVGSSGGIHAATIRYHEGTFYMITTNQNNGESINFITTATNPAGPWSEPHVLEGAPGIDPSLFFDDDGKVWYTGMHVPSDLEFEGQAEIWLQEVDLEAWRLVGRRYFPWRGACENGTWAEGPHIYKRGGRYYLMIAEGGTLHDHAVTLALADHVTGPYLASHRNPILTHRHLSYNYPIVAVGHADMVEFDGDRWYMVALGYRPMENKYKNLGRETYLIPVVWEAEPYWWKDPPNVVPVASPITGKVEWEFPMPFPGTVQNRRLAFMDEFDGEVLNLEWNFRRTHEEPFHALKNGKLLLDVGAGELKNKTQYSWMGIRQRQFACSVETAMDFQPVGENEEAGLMLIQNENAAYSLTVGQRADSRVISLTRHFHGKDSVIASYSIPDSGEVQLGADLNYLKMSFRYSIDGTNWQVLAKDADAGDLSPESAGWCYTGVYLGLFATGHGSSTGNTASFDYFHYQGLEDAIPAFTMAETGSAED